jgi:hypothetical protein
LPQIISALLDIQSIVTASIRIACGIEIPLFTGSTEV